VISLIVSSMWDVGWGEGVWGGWGGWGLGYTLLFHRYDEK
jgi:hypothetical protein